MRLGAIVFGAAFSAQAVSGPIASSHGSETRRRGLEARCDAREIWLAWTGAPMDW